MNTNLSWAEKIARCDQEYVKIQDGFKKRYEDIINTLAYVREIAKLYVGKPNTNGLLATISDERAEFIVLKDEANSKILTISDERGAYIPLFTSTGFLAPYEKRCPSTAYPSRGAFPEPFVEACNKRVPVIIDPFEAHAYILELDSISSVEWWRFPSSEIGTDYTNRCGNCHEAFASDEDKYCSFCGTKRGEGEFKPYDNRMYCIYGPMPQKRKRECVRCGNQWTYTSMLDKEKFCVRCGGQSKLIQDRSACLYPDDMRLDHPHEVKAVYANCCNKVVPANYSHCPFCGNVLADNTRPAEEDIIIDPDETIWICQCKQAVPLRYRYCGRCGHKRR